MWDNFHAKTCIYCGDIWRIEKHHYKESVANSGRKRTFGKKNTLPTCRECNALLGASNPSYIDCCPIISFFVIDRSSHRKKFKTNRRRD